MRTYLVLSSVALAGVLGVAGCKSSGSQPNSASSQPAASTSPDPSPASGSADTITVTFQAKSGSSLTGTAKLTDTGSGVRVVLEVAGLTPGKHGAHVHEKPDCSADDASSAGGHYNPHNKEHALPPGAGHLGDFGNIEAGADGTAKLDITMAEANLKAGDASSFRDRAIIIHAAPDDGGQPTGNAGGRVGCAEIR